MQTITVASSADVAPDYSNGFQVGTTAGNTNTRVSSQWYNRPDDERFLDLASL